jgi:hypothetical protein
MLGCNDDDDDDSATKQTDEQTAVQTSLKQLTEKQPVLDLIFQYSYTWDKKDPDAFAKLFTEDAVWEWWGPEDVQEPRVRNKTRYEIQNWVAERFVTTLADRQTRHLQTNTVFLEMTNDMARTQTMLLLVHIVPGVDAPIIVNTGIYEDEFLKTSDGWQISQRSLRVD